MIRTTNSCCGNEAGLVEKFIGTAYDVVKTVYNNLGELQFIYDFLNNYGVLISVSSVQELQLLPTTAKYARVYTTSTAGERIYTDYLYVDGDRTGVLPSNPTATGSWVNVSTSTLAGRGASGGYIPFVYNNGFALGGETTITVPDGTVGVPFIIVNGYTHYIGKGFTYSVSDLEVTLTQPLETGDEVVLLLTGVPAVPDNPNVDNWTIINWLYNQGAAVGGEQVIQIPYTFQDIPAVYKNGLRFYKGLSTNSYTIDADNQRIILTEALATNDRLIIQLGGEARVLEVADHTIQEVARAANVKDSQVILSTDSTQVLNGKTIIFDVTTQQSYGLPPLPTNVYIDSVSNGKLTYNPGSVEVDLVLVPESVAELKATLESDAGADSIHTTEGSTVQEELDALNASIIAPYIATGATRAVSKEDRASVRYTVGDFSGYPDDAGLAVNEIIAQYKTEEDPINKPNIKGGTITLMRGKLVANTQIDINRDAGQTGINIEGQGQTATVLDFTGSPALTDGIAGNTNGVAYGRFANFSVSNAPRRGFSFMKGSRFTIEKTQAYQAGADGFYFANTFLNQISQNTSVSNGGNGYRFDNAYAAPGDSTQFQKTSTLTNNNYAHFNTLSGYVYGNMYYSASIANGSDENGLYGYLIGGKSTGFTSVSDGAETNGRSGFAVIAAEATDEITGTTFTGAVAYNNNQANNGYPNLLYVQAINGGKATARIENSVSIPGGPGATTPDIIVDGTGAVLHMKGDCVTPRGWIARNGGYIKYEHVVHIITRNVIASTPVAVCNLKNTQGYTERYAGELLVVVGNGHPSVALRNTSVYKLLVSVTAGGGRKVTEIAKDGHVAATGNSGSFPSFTWSVNGSDQLVATPNTGVGGTDFTFEITASGQIVAYAF